MRQKEERIMTRIFILIFILMLLAACGGSSSSGGGSQSILPAQPTQPAPSDQSQTNDIPSGSAPGAVNPNGVKESNWQCQDLTWASEHKDGDCNKPLIEDCKVKNLKCAT